MALSRRDFIATACAAAALFAVGGTAYAAGSGEGSIVRPPGGQDEDRFLSLCLRCDRCRSICPQGSISIAAFENGLEGMRTPKMDFKKGICDFCGKCISVCPTKALQTFDPDAQKLGIAHVVEESCVAWKSPGSCSKCKDACPYAAVSIQGGVPVVDTSRCNGCGRCENACPALALTSSKSVEKRGIVVEPQAAA